jgi:hypothetical protein
MGLKVNEEKRKFMHATKRLIISSKLEIGSCNFEIIQEVKYLGKIMKNLRNRIILCKNATMGLKENFKSHFLTLSPKLRPYKTLLRPVLMYGSQSLM